MQNNKHLSAFSLIYGIICIIVMTFLILTFTSKGIDEMAILTRRFFISIFFLLFGGSFIKFKEKLAKLFYTRKDIATFKNEEGKQKAINEVKYMGTCVFVVGILLLTFAIILFFIS